MKLNTLIVAGICAGAFLVSCSPNTAKENQLKFTHTSLVDGDAFQFFKLVGAKVVYEKDYAAHVETIATSSEVRQLAAKVKEVYGELIPALDSLATQYQVDFPVKDSETFVAVQQDATNGAHVHEADSGSILAAAGHGHAFSDASYVQHVQHESAIIKEQFQRLTRNTNRGLRDFAVANEEKVAELFKLAGGKEDAHAHH